MKIHVLRLFSWPVCTGDVAGTQLYISHVVELKEKIDKQIVVKKELSGGSRAMIIA